MPREPRASAAEAVNGRMAKRVDDSEPFWKTKRLSQMTRTEWESLCDGCGRCCLNKLEDADTGNTFFTNVACKLFDAGSCRCKDYAGRKRKVPDCVQLTPRNVRRIVWLPPTCAYRLVAEGRDLYWWRSSRSSSSAGRVRCRRAAKSRSGGRKTHQPR
jgi:uncharacterized cysteine cluster protein YcgN (CxxCxxCC family)